MAKAKGKKQARRQTPWGPIQTACDNGKSISWMAAKFGYNNGPVGDENKPMRAKLAEGRANGKLTKNAGLQRGPGVSKATKTVQAKVKKAKPIAKLAKMTKVAKVKKNVVKQKGKAVVTTGALAAAAIAGPAYVNLLTEDGEHVQIEVTQNKLLMGLETYVDSVEPVYLAVKSALETKRLAAEAKEAANSTPVDHPATPEAATETATAA